jgi:hypothetical protein
MHFFPPFVFSSVSNSLKVTFVCCYTIPVADLVICFDLINFVVFSILFFSLSLGGVETGPVLLRPLLAYRTSRGWDIRWNDFQEK